MLKRILSASLVLVILFNGMGYYIVFELNRYRIRKEIFSLLDHGYLDHDLIKLTIYDPTADPGFKRIEKREIQYRNKMYDVAREVHKGKYISFFCINDKQEEKLINGLKSANQRKKNTDTLLRYLTNEAIPSHHVQSPLPVFKRYSFPEKSNKYHDPERSVCSPPPEET